MSLEGNDRYEGWIIWSMLSLQILILSEENVYNWKESMIKLFDSILSWSFWISMIPHYEWDFLKK